jgi:hypothetical protein
VPDLIELSEIKPLIDKFTEICKIINGDYKRYNCLLPEPLKIRLTEKLGIKAEIDGNYLRFTTRNGAFGFEPCFSFIKAAHGIRLREAYREYHNLAVKVKEALNLSFDEWKKLGETDPIEEPLKEKILNHINASQTLTEGAKSKLGKFMTANKRERQAELGDYKGLSRDDPWLSVLAPAMGRLVANADYIAFMFQPIIDLGLEKVLTDLHPSTLARVPVFGRGENTIFFGAPGTGKSTKVDKRTFSKTMIRTQFHPEYTHADFIGSYRPVVGTEADDLNQVRGHDGLSIPRPVNYFAFVPGPFTHALESAFGTSADVFLVIEEINRGDCAAIFGDTFQLLDRNGAGQSEFGITPKPELLAYLKGRSINYDIMADGKLYLPSNLSLLATMNTSDQSLYQMDVAFKRRWNWVACPLDFRQLLNCTGGVRPYLDDGKKRWDWVELVCKINENIIYDRSEDKQLGPWFIKPTQDGSVPWETFLNKGLYYLWDDVFKGQHLSELSPFKSDGPKTFGEVQENMRTNGLAAGFKAELLANIGTT